MNWPEPPDGMYIRWRGRLRPAGATVDPPNTVLVVLDPGEEIPAGYQTHWRSQRAIYVPISELTEHFSLDTYCEWMGMRCHVGSWMAEDQIVIDVDSISADRAAELGMTPMFEGAPYVKELSVSEVTELRQERREIGAG